MKKRSKSIRLIPIILSLILAMAVGLSGCVTVNPPEAPNLSPDSIPTPPDIPQEVLSIWKSEPVSVAYPPDVSGKVTLEPNKATGAESSNGNQGSGITDIWVVATAGSWQDSTNFYLQEGQWVDIIASSADSAIYFLSEEPGAVSLKSVYWCKEDDKIIRSTYDQDMGIFTPFYGKPLYENQITNTDKGAVFTTGVRLFAWGGAGDYCITFYNFSSQKGCEITYHIYKHGSTPGWGEVYKEAKLQSWLNDLYYLHVSGEITQEEYDQAESQWLEQFE